MAGPLSLGCARVALTLSALRQMAYFLQLNAKRQQVAQAQIKSGFYQLCARAVDALE
jgi:hypothetical protein